MINIFKKTAPEINKDLASRIVRTRKQKRISQKELSKRADVSYASIRRFETIGEISLLSFTKLAIALGIEDELSELWSQPIINSIEDVINEHR